MVFSLSFGGPFLGLIPQLSKVEYALADTQTFTATDTWNVPVGVTSVTVKARGGGGAGSIGNAGQPSRGGGGGGGGAYTQCTVTVTPSSPYTVTVGAAVTSGSGNASSFVGDNGTCTANAGSTSTTAAGGAGGVAQTVAGVVTAASAGGAGGNGVNAANGGGGGGGEAAATTGTGTIGTAGSGSTGGAGGTGTDGADGGRGGDSGGANVAGGVAPGGGGGGAGGNVDTVGAGARGEITLEWTVTATTTLATGTDASTATAAPGSGIRDAGSFTFATDTGTDSITALTVTLAGSGTPYSGVNLVSITNDNGSTTYFSAAASPSSNTVNFSGGTPIPVTTTPTQFKIRITPLGHLTQPVPAGAEYALSPYVSAWTGTNTTHAGTDSNSNTLTIDNLSPSNVTGASASPGNAEVTVSWTNPGGDFSNVVVLRDTATIGAGSTPAEGTSPSVDSTCGGTACVVRYISTGTSFIDTGLNNGTAYYYRIFAKDTNGNYAATGVEVNATPSAAPTTTIATGTDPSNSTVEPGAADQSLDRFSFTTNTGADTVTALTVTTANTSAISSMKIMNNAGVTQYFSTVSVPSGNNWSFSGATTISVAASVSTYLVVTTFKSHGDLASGSYAVTGNVSAFTSTNGQAGSDTAGTTITVDNAPPASASWGSITAGDTQITLNWTNPGASDFSEVVILRNTAAISDAPTDGSTYSTPGTIGTSTIVYVGGLQTATDTGLSNGTNYYYKIFARDSRKNYSPGMQTGPHAPTETPTITLATGTDPSNSTVEPGSTDNNLDRFTFVTNSGADSVTALTVTTASTSLITSMKIMNNAGGTQYFGTLTSPTGNNWSFSGGTPISVTASLSTFKILADFKTHANLASGSFTVIASVSAFTATNQKTTSDTAGTTTTVDNAPPGSVTGTSGTPDNEQVTITWANPAVSDYHSAIVLRRASAAVTDTPIEGTTYVEDNTIGSSTVACVVASPGTSCIDTGLTNNTPYHYKIFAKDSRDNYSAGVTPTDSPFTPSLILRTTLATGTDPSNSTVEPGSTDVNLNRFTFTTNSGADSVTALTVTTASTSLITSLKVMNNAGTTQYFGTLTSPTGNNWSFSGGTPISVAASVSTFKLLADFKTHANLASGSFTVVASVSAFTATNVKTTTDTAGTTTTVDNAPTANPAWGTITLGDTQITLNWTNPGASDFSEVVILRNTAAISDAPTDGSTYSTPGTIGTSTIVYVGGLQTVTDTGLTNGAGYYYKIFSKDDYKNYSSGTQTGAHEPSETPVEVTPTPTPAPSGGGGGGTLGLPSPSLTPIPIATPSATAVPKPRPKPTTITPAPAPTLTPEPEFVIKFPEIPKVSTEDIREIIQPAVKLVDKAVSGLKDAAKYSSQKFTDTVSGTKNIAKKTAQTAQSAFNATHEAVAFSINSIYSSVESVRQSGERTIGVIVSGADKISFEIYNSIDTASNKVAKGIENSTRSLARGIRENSKLAFEKVKMIAVREPVAVLEDALIIKSGELELIATQDKPVQVITGFKFTSKIKPSKPALSITDTFKYTGPDKDGFWSADGQMPPVTGRFALNANIKYADGDTKKISAITLIDPHGYIYEQTSRGELRVQNARVTLWKKEGQRWVMWPAKEYAQQNPQTTDRTGQYSFLAPDGEYYIEISADNYKIYKGQSFKLQESNPINQNIMIEYQGQSL